MLENNIRKILGRTGCLCYNAPNSLAGGKILYRVSGLAAGIA